MLTIIGTGHVFNVADPVSFIVRHCWPTAVCVELDELRYKALTADREAVEKAMKERGIDPGKASADGRSKVYNDSSRYQNEMAQKNGVAPAADMVAAIGAAMSLGAEVFCIDTDANETLERMWREMGTGERMRYRMSGITDRIGGIGRVGKTQDQFYADEEKYIGRFKRKYPTLYRILIEERDAHLASEIAGIARTHERTVAVVGDAHVSGILRLLPDDIERRSVRLKELTDPGALAGIKRRYWETDQ